MKRIIIAIILILAFKHLNMYRVHNFISAIKVEAKKVYTLTATMYNAVPSQCDSDPYTTAGMYKINPKRASEQKYIALSRDLIKRWGGEFNYGDKVLVKGAGHKDGVYIVVDTMNKRFKNRMDFLETAGTKHYKFDNVEITKV